MSGLFRQILSKLASAIGAELIGFSQSGTGAILRTLKDKIREDITVLDFMTAAQIADVRAGTFLQDVTSAMNAAATAAALAKKRLFVPSGGYKMTATWIVPPEVYVLGESAGMQTDYDPGATFLYGAVIFKAHTGNAITKTGATAYTPGAPIENITISSNRTNYPSGAGIVLDKVSGCHLIQCNTFSMGGDSYILGVTAGDVTGHNYTFNCYSNNPVGVHYRIRQKWGRYQYPVGDGGTIGMYFDGSPMSQVDGFHFEGFTQIGIKVSNGSTNVVLSGRGYIGHTAAGTVTGIQVTNEAGNDGFIAQNIHFAGSGIAGSTGVILAANALNAKILNCSFSIWNTGVSTNAGYGNSRTEIDNCNFYQNNLPIYSASENSYYTNNGFEGTVGAYTINHIAGTRGMWTGNTFDKAPNPFLSGVQGNYSGICVKNNAGFVTRNSGTTTAIAPYTTWLHGLSGVPSLDVVLTSNSSGITSIPQMQAPTATTLALYWTGAATAQWNWSARLPCDY
jgi:hypothetical protein